MLLSMRLFYSAFLLGTLVSFTAHVSYGQIPTFDPPQPGSIGRYGSNQTHTPSGQQTNPTTNYLEGTKEQVRQQNEALIREADAIITQEQQQTRMRQEMELYHEIEAAFPDIARERATAYAKSCYQDAYQKLLAMLEGHTPQSIKWAVYTVENAFLTNGLDLAAFENQIQKLVTLTREKLPAYQTGLSYKQGANLALFHTLFDTHPLRFCRLSGTGRPPPAIRFQAAPDRYGAMPLHAAVVFDFSRRNRSRSLLVFCSQSFICPAP